MIKRLGLVVLIGTLIGAYLYVINPMSYWFTPKCVLKTLTGLSCPSCGIQRFIHASCHGQWAEAIHYNYFLAISLPYAALLLVGWALPDNHLKERLEHYTHHNKIVWFYIISFFVWFVIRNILKI